MKTIERNGLHILLADEGMVLRKKGQTFFTTEIYLGNGDSAENYEEVTIEEAEQAEAENNDNNNMMGGGNG